MADVRLRGFSQVPAALLVDSKVSDRAMRLWAVLDCLQEDDPVVLLSRSELGKVLGAGRSPDTVDRAVRELEDAGFLRVHRNAAKRKPSRYTVLGRPRDRDSTGRRTAASASRSSAGSLAADSRRKYLPHRDIEAREAREARERERHSAASAYFAALPDDTRAGWLKDAEQALTVFERSIDADWRDAAAAYVRLGAERAIEARAADSAYAARPEVAAS